MMKIDQRSDESVYITLNGWIYYIDDSTGEQIIQKWRDLKTSGPPSPPISLPFYNPIYTTKFDENWEVK